MKCFAAAALCLLALCTQSHAGAERGECTPTKLLWKTDDSPQTIKPLNRGVDIRGMVQSFVVAGPEPGCVIVSSDVDFTGGSCGAGPSVTLDGDSSPDARIGNSLVWWNVPPGNHQVKVQMIVYRCPVEEEVPADTQIVQMGKRTMIIQRD